MGLDELHEFEKHQVCVWMLFEECCAGRGKELVYRHAVGGHQQWPEEGKYDEQD